MSRGLTRGCGAERLSGNKLRTVDELREVGPRGAHGLGGGNGPALGVGFTSDPVVHQLHLCAAFQSLETNVLAQEKKRFHSFNEKMLFYAFK